MNTNQLAELHENALVSWREAAEEIARQGTTIDENTSTMELALARITLQVDGKNAEQRAAQVTIALVSDREYQDARAAKEDALRALALCRTQADIAKERCQMLRALVPFIGVVAGATAAFDAELPGF